MIEASVVSVADMFRINPYAATQSTEVCISCDVSLKKLKRSIGRIRNVCHRVSFVVK